MSLQTDLTELYYKQVSGKSILVNEQATRPVTKLIKETPIASGAYAPDSPEAKKVLAKHAMMTAEKDGTPVTAHLRGDSGKGLMKRFYLAYVRQFDPITADQSVVVAIAVLSDMLKKLAEFPGGVYPKDTESFYLEVIKPSVERVVPELTKGSVTVSDTYAKYIARALKNAAIDAGIIRQVGRIRKNKMMPDVKSSHTSTAADLDRLLGL